MSMGSEARGGPAEVQLPAHLLKGRSFLHRQNLGGRVCGCPGLSVPVHCLLSNTHCLLGCCSFLENVNIV